MHEILLSPAELRFSLLIFYFFAYALVGWLWESAYVSVRKKHLTNSGFLIGPIIPVYGFSMLAVLLILEPFKNNIGLLFITGALLITLIEYVTSWLMEKLFQARWWDYSTLPLNLNGRVALPISLFWGFGVVVIVKLVHPFVSHIILGLPSVTAIATSVVLTDLLMFDLGFTVANVIGFGAATQRIGNTVETLKAELKNQVTTDTKLSRPLAWFENFRTNIKLIDQQPKLNYVQRRLLRAFPNIKFKRTTTSPTDITRIVDFLRKKRR
ncbi:putative ABC transporter permease [Loigolactobacillus coryniformis]|uniref:putative ABC transporter permease n=1 Tax=Loigolactobacillus coryniformis TaxID=1610 RepID=UPI00201A8256|nr:putative ABC transporter permease [Loigolactobacillus coryniformis]MCL5457059.1 putative ABC transporter permease [Loigolactobacillus coryniformis]